MGNLISVKKLSVLGKGSFGVGRKEGSLGGRNVIVNKTVYRKLTGNYTGPFISFEFVLTFYNQSSKFFCKRIVKHHFSFIRIFIQQRLNIY